MPVGTLNILLIFVGCLDEEFVPKPETDEDKLEDKSKGEDKNKDSGKKKDKS